MGQMTKGKSYKNVNATNKQVVIPLTMTKECVIGVLMWEGRCSQWDSMGGIWRQTQGQKSLVIASDDSNGCFHLRTAHIPMPVE